MKTLLSFRTSLALGLSGFAAIVSTTACGPTTDVGGYCDATGCYTCDGYGCSPSEATATTNVPGVPSTSATPATTNNPPAPVCKANAECGVGKACSGGACVACGGSSGPCPCNEDKECGNGKACVAGACTAKQNTCVFTSECDDQNGEVCFNGQCLDSCANTACDAGKVCQKGACVENTVTPTCSANADCGGDKPVCAGGTCTESCDDDVACGDGRYCNQGACVVDTRPSPTCASDADCGGSGMPQKCMGGYCKYSCSNDAFCRSIDSRIGYCAADLVCRTAIEAKPECTRKSDCKGALDCVNNQCK